MSINNIALRSRIALLWGIGGSFGKIAAQLIVQITLARLLGPETFGQFAIIVSIISLSSVVSDFGFGSALIQKKIITSSDISLALGWTLLIAFLISILISLTAPFLSTFFGDESLYWMITASAFFIIPNALGNISFNLLQRDLNMKYIQIIQVFSYIICFGGVATTLAIMEWGAWSLVIGYGVQTLFKAIVTYSICKHSLCLRLKGDTDIINFGLKALANDILNWTIDNFEKLLIGRYWGIHSLGLYSVAFNLSKAPSSLFIYAIQSISFATASRLQDEVTILKNGFRVIVTILALTTIPFFSTMAYESKEILSIVYGNKWIAAAPYMTALSIAIPFISIGSITAAILRGKGEIEIELRIQLITAVLLFLGFYNFRGWPLEVAVWIVPIIFLLRLILLLLVIKKQLALNYYDLLILFRGALVLTILAVSVTALVRDNIKTLSIATEIVPFIVGMCACLVLLITKFNWITGVHLELFFRTRHINGPIGHAVKWLQR